jgi:hypothetical protein
MNRSNVHAILSEIYRLLGDYLAADLIQASEYRGITPDLKQALRALAREAGPPSRRQPKRSTSRRSPPADSAGASAQPADQPARASDVADVIRLSKRLDSNPAILQFAKDVGLKIMPRPKESRRRLAKRVAEAISLVPQAQRAQILEQLSGDVDRQTQGWLDAIKSARQ